MDPIRYIFSEPADGAMNMALDEALLEAAADSPDGTATLRIYQWAQPTLSLGYFQTAAERETHSASRDCDLIRRPSGGGAILHDRELTYALVLPAAIAHAEEASAWYFKAHEALIAAIGEVNGATASLCVNPPKVSAREEPFLCFQRRASGDVLLQEHKIAGSAQRRRRGAVLQHGSVLLRGSPFAPEIPGIAETSGADIDLESLASRFTELLAHALAFEVESSGLTPQEIAVAQRLADTKYRAPAWTMRR